MWEPSTLLGFLLLAEALLLLPVAFVGFGPLLDCDGPALAVLAQVRVRLGVLPVPEVDRLQPVVGELPPAVRAHRTLCLPLRSFPLRAAPFLFPGGLAAAGKGAASRRGLPIASSSGRRSSLPKRQNVGPAGPCSRSSSSVVATIGMQPS
ncbi:hypothetical protein [Streptomyces sp. NPDC056949]|uniref:hypothetical protein n=1 Tax=Streptomyces sp. NPDC056949 TaxID=3345976 RepID=UPI003630895E